jgi:hypothetical protein
VPPEPGTVDEPTSEEVDLATRARAGDRTAYSQLVATHQQIASVSPTCSPDRLRKPRTPPRRAS